MKPSGRETLDKRYFYLPTVMLWGVAVGFGLKLLIWHLKMHETYDPQTAQVLALIKTVVLVSYVFCMVYEYIRFREFLSEQDDE